MISLTPLMWRSATAMPAHAPPAAHPAAAMTGSVIQPCPAPKYRATPVAAQAPRYSWPSPPTFIRPTRAGTAVASPVNTSGIISTPTSLRPTRLPSVPDITLVSASAGFRPKANSNKPNTARARHRARKERNGGMVVSCRVKS